MENPNSDRDLSEKMVLTRELLCCLRSREIFAPLEVLVIVRSSGDLPNFFRIELNLGLNAD